LLSGVLALTFWIPTPLLAGALTTDTCSSSDIEWGTISSLNVGNSQLVITNSNVGIGTSQPTARLDLQGATADATTTVLDIEHVDSVTSTPRPVFQISDNGSILVGPTPTSAASGATQITFSSSINLSANTTTFNGNLRVSGVTTFIGDARFNPYYPLTVLGSVVMDPSPTPTPAYTPAAVAQVARPFAVQDSSGDNLITVNGKGNVGIGYAPVGAPSPWPSVNQLEIGVNQGSGNIRVRSGYVFVKPNPTPVTSSCTADRDGAVILTSTYHFCVCRRSSLTYVQVDGSGSACQ
jgi:hypothetical protein